MFQLPHRMLKKSRGMSLIEIMLYISIAMGLMVGIVQIYKRIQNSMKKSGTQSLLFQVQNGIEEFKRDIGRYPIKLEELVSGPSNQQEKRKWSDSYVADKSSVVDGTVRDSYGNELVYTYDKGSNKFDLYSWGPEGVGAEFGHIIL